MPRKFSADVVTTNVRLPKRLHKFLEQEAKRQSSSINAEVVGRLEKSIQTERLPSAEQLAQVLLIVARRQPAIMEDPKVKDLVELLEEAVFQSEIMGELKQQPRMKRADPRS
jgi:hypothetical protein